MSDYQPVILDMTTEYMRQNESKSQFAEARIHSRTVRRAVFCKDSVVGAFVFTLSTLSTPYMYVQKLAGAFMRWLPKL